ncbi:MAG TPA: T9SS type A sorting domain-containing protein [Chitinophagales bacterium]|nr:T9SS type A sorting domain-containing protein [Chitinophagales bacterium]
MKYFYATGLLLFAMGYVNAQNAQQALQDVWREKTEWRQKANEQQHGSPAGASGQRSFNEVDVSTVSGEVQSEVHAAINPTDTNNIVVSSNFVSTNSFLPTQTNYIYYTNDFGNTWQQSSFLTAPAAPNAFILGGGDPNFVFTDQGKLYFSWINLWSDASFNSYFDLYWASSQDGGNAWQRNSTNDYIGTTPSSLFGGGGGFDKEWLAADNNPSSPYYGNLYCSFFQIDGSTNQTYIGLRTNRVANGVFDTVTTKVNSGTYKFEQFASSAVDNNGKVHVTFFASVDSVTYSLYHAVSNDGGQSFQTENKISDVSLARYSSGQQNDSILGIDNTRLYPCAYVSCDNSHGPHANNLYMVWTANGTTARLNNGNDVYFSKSIDGGATWSAAQILNDNTTNLTSDQYYPSLTVSPQGRLIIMWWDRRDDAQNKNSNIYLTYSDDGGQTFATDMKVTSVPTDFSQVGAQNGGFGIGEYNAVLATSQYAIPVWADGRDNNGQLNLYAAFINLGADTVATGLQDITAINSPLKIYSLYPNPAKEEVTLNYETSQAGKIEITLYDAQGKEVKALKPGNIAIGKGNMPVNVNQLAAGNYLMKINFNGAINVRRFVKSE